MIWTKVTKPQIIWSLAIVQVVPFTNAITMAALGDVIQKLHPNEDLSDLIKLVLGSLGSLHISCGVNCLEVTKSRDNFLGICVFYKDGSQVLVDNGRRIRSGYIFTERGDVLENKPRPEDTMHKRLYNMMFDRIESKAGVVIVGFAQQGKRLKGTSGTFNNSITTNLLSEGHRQALFSLRTLIFGSIIVHKINGARNVSPLSACLALCLFLIVKVDGDEEDLQKLPIIDFELDNQKVFLRQFFGETYKVAEQILIVAFQERKSELDDRAVRLSRASWAMKLLSEGFKAEMRPDEFSSFMHSLAHTYGADTFIGSIITWLLQIFFPTLCPCPDCVANRAEHGGI